MSESAIALIVRTSELLCAPLMIDHDRLFKELLSTFFIDFLDLFIPEIASTIAPNSIVFLQQEYFADLVEGGEKVIDLYSRGEAGGSRCDLSRSC